MPKFSATVETTSNANAGAFGTSGNMVNVLCGAGREMKLIAVILRNVAGAAQDLGRVVVDRITAVNTANVASFTPLELDPGGAASAITDATKVISTACNGSGGTAADSAVVEVCEGYNDFSDLNIMSGVAQGFAIRRATAPTGSRTCVATLIWEE